MSKKDTDLLKLFGVEGLATLKTIMNETKREVERKKPSELVWDVRALLDEITLRMISRDIVGCCDGLDAIQIRLDHMKKVAAEIRKQMGK